MKRLSSSFILLLCLFGLPGLAQGDYVSGDFETSGHVVVGNGWQRYRTESSSTIPIDVRGTIPGVIGAYTDSNNVAARNNRNDDFRFFLDEVEIDLAKSFDENIRFRADLDFGANALFSGARFANAGGAADDVGVLIEQIYATANVGIGNGLEVLLGRFNAPIGFESVDVVENDTVGCSTLYRALRPHHFTGVKFFYPFTDAFTIHVFAANNGLTHDDGDVFTVNTDIPAGGFRLNYRWGEEGNQSHVGLSGAWGQDHANVKNGWTFLGDIDWEWWVSDSLAIGGEGIYRQIDTRTAATPNAKYLGGLLNLHYLFDPEWSATFKYAYAHDINGTNEVISVLGTGVQSLTGADQQIHEVIFGGTHPITENAILKLEGGYVFLWVAGPNQRQVYSVAGTFAYLF